MHVCQICNKTFLTVRSLNGHKRVHSNKSVKTRVSKVLRASKCLHCQKDFIYNKRTNTGKYCCQQCQHDFQWSVKKAEIEQGSFSGYRTLRRFLVEKTGNKCAICTLDTIWNDKSLTLQIDHIDGNSDNNILSNFRLLCPNCHSQTDTFTSRNFKNTSRAKYARQWRDRFKRSQP